MKTTSLLFTLLISITSIAQNFAPIGAKWHFQNECPTPAHIDNCGFYTIEVNRDTTINGNLCTILEKDTGIIVPEAQLIIWEDNNKVYFFENNQFKLLFDFNLNAGDTLTYRIPHNYNGHYNLVCGSYSDSSKFAHAIIDSTKNITINSQNLKTLYTSTLDPFNSNHLGWELGQITERIGCSENSVLFGHSQTICLGTFSGHFRCYSDNLINYKPVSEDCDYITGIDQYSINNFLNISPNPTSSNFTIKGLNTPYNIIIYNSIGQNVYSEKNITITNKVIDVTPFNKGLLFIRIEAEGEVYYQKIIKQ